MEVAAKDQVIGFVQGLFPDERLGWDAIALPLAGFINSASAEDRYQSGYETLLMLDTADEVRKIGEGQYALMLKSRVLANAVNVVGITDSHKIKAIAQILLVAGRTIKCIKHTKQALGVHQESTSTRQSSVSLGKDYPWVQRLINPTVMRTVDEWLGWIGSCFSRVDGIEKFCKQYHLGTRYYGLWRALNQFDSEEQRKANNHAYHYAHLVAEEGKDFLDRVLSNMRKRNTAMDLTLSTDELTQVVEQLTKGEDV